MKVSTNTIRFLNQHYDSAGDPVQDGVDHLVQKIGAQLGAVEETTPFGALFTGVLVVRVVSCEDHPNADRLHVCLVDDGGQAQGVERNEQGYVQVVCGAPNVHEGMLAAWLPPGSTVPSTRNADPFVLDARELRGVMSNGMMASPKELALGNSHEGILEVDADVAPGTPFAEAYNLTDDVIIDIENKMFTHRPDCFGWLGVAREIEGIHHRPYTSPTWYTPRPALPDVHGESLKLEVRNELPELSQRFTAIVMRDVQVKASPVWLVVALARAGIRSINNIVDYTNFFMLETGQPLHAYDYDKVMAQDKDATHATLVVRHPQPGETINLLNGKEIEPRQEAIMIATRDKLIGIGGVMGGADTEVDEHTKNIIIECANFDMYSVRRTSMAHGLFTDAVTRFNKGQSPLQNLAVLAKIVDEINQYAGGTVASPVIDDVHLAPEVLERQAVHPAVTLTQSFITTRLGLELSAEEIAALLRNVEFTAVITGDELTVTAPFWRTDIAIAEDIVEEVGRLYGYDHLPLRLPKRDLTPVPKDAILGLKTQLRDALSRSGANELLTYSFVHGDLLRKAQQDVDRAFRLSNALSPQLQYYRLSLTPSLLEHVHSNSKAGYDTFGLFEINTVHPGGEARDETDLPLERRHVAYVFAADDKASAAYAGAPYYQVRQQAMALLEACGVAPAVTLVPLVELKLDDSFQQIVAPYDISRSAVICDREGNTWGVIGEFKAAVRKGLKLPAFCAGFEIDVQLFTKHQLPSAYKALPRFPKVTQDMCLRVPAELSYGELVQFVEDHLQQHRPDETHHVLSPVDIYQRTDEAAHKQITFRLSIASYERTLTDDEVNALLDRLAEAAKQQFGAERI